MRPRHRPPVFSSFLFPYHIISDRHLQSVSLDTYSFPQFVKSTFHIHLFSCTITSTFLLYELSLYHMRELQGRSSRWIKKRKEGQGNIIFGIHIHGIAWHHVSRSAASCTWSALDRKEEESAASAEDVFIMFFMTVNEGNYGRSNLFGLLF